MRLGCFGCFGATGTRRPPFWVMSCLPSLGSAWRRRKYSSINQLSLPQRSMPSAQ